MDKWTLSVTSDSRHTRFAEVPHYEEGLYGLNGEVYAWLVPNGSWGESNAGLVVGDGASLLVDTLWDLNCTHQMLDAMRPLMQVAPLKHVVNTHADGDHWWGNQLVGEAEIIASTAACDEMRHIQPQSMILLGKFGRLLSALRLFGADKVGHWFHNMVAPYDFGEVRLTPATRTFQGELRLDVGGREVHLIEIGPAHTEGDILVHVPDARVLFTADILFIGSTPVMWAGPVENWLAALDRILGMEIDAIVPGHGPITDKAGVRQVKAYWEYLSTEVPRRYAAGMSAPQAAYDIALDDGFARLPFANWNSPERIMTNVHTMYRHLQGRLDPLKPLELVNIMRRQALLAHRLPDAQPAVMRKHWAA